MTMKIKTGLLAALALGAMTAVGVAADRVVNVYNWSDYIDPSILEDFTKETGIKVKYDVFDSNDLLETKLLAGKTGYDVVVPSANFLGRQIDAGVFVKLDKSKLPGLSHAWPEVSKRLAAFDPGNQYAVNYMWGTTGIGYNVNKIKERMPDAPLDSWRMVFDPEVISKFKDCGVMFLDAPDEVIPAALNYLGKNPNSRAPEDFAAAEELLKKVRPFVKKFHSSEYINALANGDACLVIGWSGDIKQAASRAEEKSKTIKDPKKKVEVGYTIPKEGAGTFYDNLTIPKDAKNIDEAYAFIDYLLRPEVIAKASNEISYANGNIDSQAFIKKEILEDRSIFPDEATMAKLFTVLPLDQKAQRESTKIWRDIKRKG
ncbi:MAG: polyamine ABC transporter substrate-binding protein [Alphaproteobacteria bacterium]|nr:polyamine ABC transporter substrate-binding protein [Alphaproteobacteria bacterium]